MSDFNATLVCIAGSPVRNDYTTMRDCLQDVKYKKYIFNASQGKLRYPKILGYCFVANEDMVVPTLTTCVEGQHKDFVIKAEDFQAKRKVCKGEKFVVTPAELFVMVAEAEKPLVFNVVGQKEKVKTRIEAVTGENAMPWVILVRDNNIKAKKPLHLIKTLWDAEFKLTMPEFEYLIDENRCPSVYKSYTERNKVSESEPSEIEACKKLKGYLKEIFGVV